MMSVTITIKQLKALGACSNELYKIETEYGKSKTYDNIETLAKDVKYLVRVWWAVGKLLTLENRKAYKAAVKSHRDAYIAATKSIRDADAIKSHWNAFKAACSLEFAKLYFEQVKNTRNGEE